VQLSYHPRRNIGDLRVRDSAGVEVETLRLSDEVNVDLAPDGSVHGIELSNANAQLGATTAAGWWSSTRPPAAGSKYRCRI
jgi:uncharacterized protein YuzE